MLWKDVEKNSHSRIISIRIDGDEESEGSDPGPVQHVSGHNA